MVPSGGAGSPAGAPADDTSGVPADDTPGAPADDTSVVPAGPASAEEAGRSAVSPSALAICPYLVDAAGAWRRAQPSRSHRCGARSPAPTIPALTQKRICLTDEHLACEFYVAATRARDEALLADHVRLERLETSRFQVFKRPLPVATDGVPGVALPVASRGPTRPSRPVAVAVALAGLVVALALVAVIAALQPGGPGGIAGISPTPGATPNPSGPSGPPVPSGPSQGPSSSPTSTPIPSPGTSVSPTPEPTPTPRPRTRRYEVKRGDTLNRIAARFDTTVRAIRELNGLRENEDIRIGQVLQIPGD